MKLLTLMLSLTAMLNANSQDLAKKLQANAWFVNEEPLRPETYSFLKEKPSGPAIEVKFLLVGHFQIKMDESGDFKFICPYELKKDVLKIYYSINTPKKAIKKENVAHYYRVTESADHKHLELTPVTAADFK